VAAYLRRGEIYRSTGDQDLFNFAFNKSNIDASSFNFKSYAPREWTHVERACLANSAVVEAISDTAEYCCGEVNRMFGELLNARLHTPGQASALVERLSHECRALFPSPESTGSRRIFPIDLPQERARCA